MKISFRSSVYCFIICQSAVIGLTRSGLMKQWLSWVWLSNKEHSVLHPVSAMTPYKMWEVESDSPEHPFIMGQMSLKDICFIKGHLTLSLTVSAQLTCLVPLSNEEGHHFYLGCSIYCYEGSMISIFPWVLWADGCFPPWDRMDLVSLLWIS